MIILYSSSKVQLNTHAIQWWYRATPAAGWISSETEVQPVEPLLAACLAKVVVVVLVVGVCMYKKVTYILTYVHK